ncbi:MAG: hypothetical protein JNJ40_06365 [Bacteroidia bacterium]|nr:hypothetical protein [Bacteroidia bacterium]
METTITSTQTKQLAKTTTTKKNQSSTFWQNAEFNRFGIICMVILIIGCVGGFAASFGANGDALKLSLIAFPTIISLALVLAVAPMKAIIYLSSVALLLDAVVLIF